MKNFTLAYKTHPHGNIHSMTVRAYSTWEARKKILSRLYTSNHSLHMITFAGME